MKWFVYVIWARDEDGEEWRYYGHTKDMKDREDRHVSSYNVWVRAGRPDNIRESGSACRSVFVMDVGGWSMDILHELECDEDEASRVEGNYIRNNKCVNRFVPGRTKAQYHQDNRDTRLPLLRQYYYDNRDERLEYGRLYYQDNKAKISAKQAEKVPCPCGALITRSNISSHLRSQRHARGMQQSTSSS